MTRILFISSNRIGDAVLSTGALNHLVQSYPGAKITVAAGPLPARLFEGVPGLERLLPMTKGKYAAHWRRLWLATVGTRWDVVVDMRASALAWLLWAKQRKVFRSEHNEPVHRLVQMGRLLGLATPPAPHIWSTARAEADAATLIPAGGPVLGVGPTANWGGKCWPVENFVQAVARLTAPDGLFPGARVAVFGAPHERPGAQALLDSLPAAQRIDLIGAADLLTVHSCLARCAFYVGNDSGLMHLAAAAGTPTVGLFGPSPEISYAPWGPKTVAVRGPRSFEQIVLDPSFDHRSSRCLMTDLTVDRVVEAAAALWTRVAS